ncbi:MAG: hypothetical protein OCD00_10520 [Colwellia sp.]
MSPKISDLKSGINLAIKNNSKSLLILSCSQNNFQKNDISPILTELKTPVFGGIYPMVIYQEELMKKGSLIIGFPTTIDVHNFTNINKKLADIALLEQKIEQDSTLQLQNDFLMFYDGLMSNSENFIECFYELLDHEITIAGGGAGSLDFIQRPCVFTNQGLLTDVIQLVALPYKLHLGVAHGWEVLKGPFLVSEAEGAKC